MASTVVLVVEDEPIIRYDAVDLVEEAGFAVKSAANAADALEILEGDDHIGVLFTDIQMPGPMDGLDLAQLVRRRWPQISIILVSGHVNPQARDGIADGVFFSKPYPRLAVIEALGAAASR